MTYAFNHLNSIEKVLRRSPFGLITDIDGTISPTAPTPQEARISPLCRHYLSILCNRLALVAAISGRPATEIKNMIKVERMVYVGNHGLERWNKDHSEYPEGVQHYSKAIKAIIKELTPFLAIKGVTIEDKRITATIHYRLCREPQLVERAILDVVEKSPQAKNLRIIQERMAIDLLPHVKVNKGTATMDLIQEYNLHGGVYLGDDLTDIDAFKAIHAAARDFNFQGLAIGVTSEEMTEKLVTEADFTLKGVNDVERFLKWMSQVVPEPG